MPSKRLPSNRPHSFLSSANIVDADLMRDSAAQITPTPQCIFHGSWSSSIIVCRDAGKVRPSLTQMIEDARKGIFGHVVIADIYRLGREFRTLLSLFDLEPRF